MNWMNQMNRVMDYVEEHLKEELDYKEIERIAKCSIYNFQRMFSYIVDQSFSTYVRNRRLTLAALDVIGSNKSILEIAVDYGYSSNESFSRAFSKFHGVLPSDVKKERVQLTSVPKLSFQLNVKGDEAMNYTIEDWPAFQIAGFKHIMKTDESFNIVPKLWADSLTNGCFQDLINLCMKADMRPAGVLGIANESGELGENMAYYLAVTTHVDVDECKVVEIPSTMETLEIAQSKWVIIQADGEAKDAVQNVYKTFYSQWLPSSGYRLVDLPVIECYFQDDHQEVWIAVEK